MARPTARSFETARKPHVPGGPVGHPVGVSCNQGVTNGMSKLTEAQVWEIRAVRETGLSYEKIARQFGVGYSTVWNICNRRRWVHLRTPPKPPAPAVSGRYTHTQPVPAAVWMVLHGLGYQPHVTVVDESQRVVYAEVEHVDINTLVVRFSPALAGSVFCS